MQFNPHDHYPSADSTTPIADLLLRGHAFLFFLFFLLLQKRGSHFKVGFLQGRYTKRDEVIPAI